MQPSQNPPRTTQHPRDGPSLPRNPQSTAKHFTGSEATPQQLTEYEANPSSSLGRCSPAAAARCGSTARAGCDCFSSASVPCSTLRNAPKRWTDSVPPPAASRTKGLLGLTC
eukprot:2047186-Prymnesium_polylepis.2